jgi:acyl-coenzyme A thioesterase PaaI-like protein
LTSDLRETTDRSDVRVSPTAAFEFAPHNCFACGTLNTNGLQLALHLEAARSWTELRLDRRFEGWQGIAHGGIVSTILDEVMAWALVAEDHWGVTARMSVEFRKPVPIDTPIRADGWITRSRRRIVETAAELVDPASGVVLATAQGTYVAADAARKQELRDRYGFRFLERVADTPEPVDVDSTNADATDTTATNAVAPDAR